VLLSLFSSLTEALPINIILLQDPPYCEGFLPVSSGFKSFAPPTARPNVAYYVSLKLLQRFSVLRVFSPDLEDFIAVKIYKPQGCFGSSFPRFWIDNDYTWPVNPPHCLVSPETAFISCDYPYLVAGDFNIYNTGGDPFRVLFSNSEKRVGPLFPDSLRTRLLPPQRPWQLYPLPLHGLP